MGFPSQEYLERVIISFSRSSQPRDRIHVSFIGRWILSHPPGKPIVTFSSVQLLSCVRLFAMPWIAARQASLSITNSQSLLRPMSIESVMPSSHLILCRPLLLLPPIPPSIRVFSNESTLGMRWPNKVLFYLTCKNNHKYFPIHAEMQPLPPVLELGWPCD